jgi:O-antigen/teichoic acid export membrane protein
MGVMQIQPPSSAPASVSPPAGLLPRILRSSLWILNSNVVNRALTFARGVILARLLIPADFGIFNLASVIIGSTVMFSDIGGGTFLVYHPEDADALFPTAFWANLGVATILGLGVAASSSFVARFYDRPELVPILRVLSVALWLQAATNVHRNLLRCNLRFRALSLFDSISSLVMFLSALALAWRGLGAWSFVLSTVLANLVSLVLLLFAFPRLPAWEFSWKAIGVMAPFSGWYVCQAVVWQFVYNIDNLMVGKLLGMEALGVYSVAYSYAMMPVTFIATTMLTVVFAELPRLHNVPDQFWLTFRQISTLLSGLVCPIAAALFASAPDLIPLVFGSKWNGAVFPFQIITIYGAIRCLWVDPIGALGRFKLGFFLGLGILALSVVSIRDGIRYGAHGVSFAVLGVGCVAQITSLFLAGRSWRLVRQSLGNSLPHFAVAAAAALVATLIRHAALGLIGDQKPVMTFLSASVVVVLYTLAFRKSLFKLMSHATNTLG